MTTNKQIAANRRNAQLSTGPRTETGKQRSRLNALKHGLRAAMDILPGEDVEQLDNLRETLRDSCQPSCGLEEVLVAQMVDAEWRRQRYIRFETGLFYYRHCVADLPNPRNYRAPAWPSTPEQESLFRYGRVIQDLTGEDDFVGSLVRYEASTRRAFFQALRAFIGQRQYLASGASRANQSPRAALPFPGPVLEPPTPKKSLPNEPILEQVPIKPTA